MKELDKSPFLCYNRYNKAKENKTIKKAIIVIGVLYLVASCVFSVGYALSDVFSLEFVKMKMDDILSRMDSTISVNGMLNKHPIFNFKIIVKMNERSSYLIYT